MPIGVGKSSSKDLIRFNQNAQTRFFFKTHYVIFIHCKLITYLNTNLAASQIVVAYGNCARSIIREIFNLVAFQKETIDERNYGKGVRKLFNPDLISLPFSCLNPSTIFIIPTGENRITLFL